MSAPPAHAADKLRGLPADSNTNAAAPEDQDWEDVESDDEAAEGEDGEEIEDEAEPDDAEDDDSDSDNYEDSEDEDDSFLLEEEIKLRPLRYSDECPALPASRPRGYPHIVNTSGFDEEVDTKDLTLADGIATFLWNWDRAQFNRFFDLSKKNFLLRYVAPEQPLEDMTIERSGSGVLAGFRIDDGCGGKEWDPQVLFTIKPDGKWVGTHCMHGTRPATIEFYGMSVSRAIFFHRLWKIRRSTTKITTHHDR